MKNWLLYALGLLLMGCQPKSDQKENSTKGKDSTVSEKQEPANQAPETYPALKVNEKVLLSYVYCESCGFTFMKDTKYGVVTFYGKLKLKNTSGQIIRKAVIDMPLRVKYQSGFIDEFELCPGTNGRYNYITGLKGEWVKPDQYKSSLGVGYAKVTDWEPGEVRIFEIYMGSPANKVTGEAPFKRTPEELTLKPKVRALMALDYELDFESMQYFDVKDQWKQTQRELGYRE